MLNTERHFSLDFSVEYYFPTLVFNFEVKNAEAVNEYLVDAIRKLKASDKAGIERSNFRALGGWHSRNDLHTNERFDRLTKLINHAADKISSQLGYDTETELVIGSMWSIINPPGGTNRSHIHPNSHWSGVYYVQAPENCGDIEFTDPRTEHVMNEPSFEPGKSRGKENWTKVRFTPRAGKMLLFPSWLYHGVHPNCSEFLGLEGERIIVSFNLSQRKR